METVGDRGAPVFLGVDTHSDVHLAVALDGAGRRLGALAVPNDRGGYARLWDWMLGFDTLVAAGVEGTGSYGAGLSRFLQARGASVLEVNRTSRQHRHGKHDAGDAEAAARAVMAGTASGEPKKAPTGPRSRCGPCASPGAAVKARTQAAHQLHALLSSAPDRRRHRVLSEEIAELDARIERLVEEVAPELVALEGVGPDTAATLLVAAGDNPERLRSEAAFAHLCGAAPVPASSGNPRAGARPAWRRRGHGSPRRPPEEPWQPPDRQTI